MKDSRKPISYMLAATAETILGSIFFVVPILYVVLKWFYSWLGASGETASALVWGTIVAILFFYAGTMSTAEAQSSVESKASRELNIEKSLSIQLRQNLERESEELNREREELSKERELFNSIVESKAQDKPEMAAAIADYQYLLDLKQAEKLAKKKNPAIKASEQVKEIAKEKRRLEIQNRKMKYQLDFLYATVPFLEDYAQLSPVEATRYTQAKEADEDEVKNWLSPEEYMSLSTSEKNQRALDRYKRRNKSNWEAGIDYERYIGYTYEARGYSVTYTGATLGLDDLGIDLIAVRDADTVLIQCKRYSAIKSRVVRENTVAQLYGSAALYRAEHPLTNVKPVIYTSSELSAEAKRFADLLEIEVVDNCPLEEYPMIKCNISQRGEKIYHLPFDQQYDKVKIAGKAGAVFVSTVVEAEKMGFRRAYRWHKQAQ